MFAEILIDIARGIPTTILVTVTAFLIGFFVGIPLAVALRSPSAFLRLPIRGLVNIVRAVPILMWLFLLYFGVAIGAFHFNPFSAAVIVLGITTASYFAEVYRTAFDSIDHGQFEASRSLGLGRFHELVYVTFPKCYWSHYRR